MSLRKSLLAMSPGQRSCLRVVGVGVGIALAANGVACTATVSAAPPPPAVVSGSAILDWTIQGTKDPAECAAFGATTFNVALYSAAGGPEGQWTQDCTAFATTISALVPDTYTGNANLLDPTGAPRTTTVNIAPFAVIGGTTVTVAVDFPGRSFF